MSTATERQRKTVGDLVRSLALVLAFVAVLVIFNVVQQPDNSGKSLAYPAVLGENQVQAPYAVLGPQPLPEGWRVTSARARRAGDAVTWHLGMVTAAGTYAAVEQSDGAVEDLVEQHAESSTAAGTVVIEGVRWRRLTGGSPEPRALLRRGGDVATLVAGSASWRELRAVAGSLAPAP